MNKIVIMSAVALAMAAVPGVKASGSLLSPRAQGNQIKIASVSMETERIMPDQGVLLSPRARGNQIVKVAGMDNEPNLVTLYNHLTVSPRALAQYPARVYQTAPIN